MGAFGQLATTAAPTAAAAAAECPDASTAHGPHLRLLRLCVAHSLVHGQDHARCLCGRSDRVPLHHRRLPDEGLVGVHDAALVHVHAKPFAALCMLLAELVEDVSRVQARVLCHLARDDLEGLGVGAHEELLLAVDASRGLAEVLGDLHLDGATASHNGRVLHKATSGEDGILETALCLVDELLGAAAQDDRVGERAAAPREEVEALPAHLLLLEEVACAQHVVGQPVARGLHCSPARGSDTLHVVLGHAPSAEDVAVGEVLRGQVADGQAREHDLGPRGVDEVELLVDDGPLCIHDSLILRGLGDTDLGIILLRLELELHVEEHDLAALEALGLLLEAGVGEGLFEGHTLHEERVLERAALDLLDADHVQGEVVVE
mmetsp:Transcript_12529/g.33537  ORF Transcript_12529/g.33537 Transcript_12529/m.33537 type:complete len:377 (+) Transcript_12529:444-1574(+)